MDRSPWCVPDLGERTAEDVGSLGYENGTEYTTTPHRPTLEGSSPKRDAAAQSRREVTTNTTLPTTMSSSAFLEEYVGG